MRPIFSKTLPKVAVIIFILSSCSKAIYDKRMESAEKVSDAADELLIITNALKNEINQKVEENPNSSSEDFVELVNEKSEEIEMVQSQIEKLAPKRTVEINQKRNFNKIRSYQQRLSSLSREIDAIHQSFEKELDKKLLSDVYFNTGSAKINVSGKEDLKAFVFSDIQNIIEEWENQEIYNDHPKKIKIKVVGYADLQGVANREVRKSNNLILSENRANTVKMVLGDYLDELKSKYMIQVVIEHEGKGEDPPPGLTDIDLPNNADRRICLISSYVIPVF